MGVDLQALLAAFAERGLRPPVVFEAATADGARRLV
jgi:hypothetical protein